MEEKKEIYLIDGSAYIYRAYYAVAPLSNSQGVATHAVLGFINMVKRLQKDKNPRFLAIAFDSKGKVFRHQIYDQYKANRPTMPEDLQVQVPYIKRFVEAAGIRLLEQEGVEADDIMATVAKKFGGGDFKIVLVSGDKDLLQLVDDGVTIFDPMKDKVFGQAEVKQKYDVEVEQLLDYFSLVGDSSDNVPGVPGVGPKTAAKLINSFGSLDGVYEGLDTMKKTKMREKIQNNKDQAYLSKTLIALKEDVELDLEPDLFAVGDGKDEDLAALYRELEFTSLLKGIESATRVDTENFITVQTANQLEMLMQELETAKLFAFDTETTSLDARRAVLVGLSCCTCLDRAYYIPLGHLDEEGNLREDQLPEDLVMHRLQQFLVSDSHLKIAHNLKYDFTVIKNCWGIEPAGPLADTMIAAHLTEEGNRSLKLDTLCLARGLRMTSFDEVVRGDKRDNSFAFVDIDRATDYSCEDVYGTLFLWQELEESLREKGVAELFYQVEMPIVSVLVDMELAGIRVDNIVLQNLGSDFSQKINLLEEKIHGLVGHEFNINSPRQLGTVLFEELGLPHGRKTKTGFSTDVKVLQKLSGKHQIPALVLEYRSFAKLLSTYVEKLKNVQDVETCRVHSSFNQTVTATGRLSSSEPNLQNIPIRTEEGGRIREAFVPGEGLFFLSADYSQIDLRVLAHYSKDKALVSAFCEGEDIHTRTAAEIFSVSPLLVNSEMRRTAKSINFGIVYGMSSFGLSSQLDISRKEAQRFIDRYFGLYSGVKRYMEEIVDQARENGYVTTLLGRRRTVADINAKNRNQREFAERMAINTPIQGTAADIIKLAMLRCRDVLFEHGLAARMLLQIHDELVFELPEDELQISQGVIKQAMENALVLDVPLVVNFEVGRNLSK